MMGFLPSTPSNGGAHGSPEEDLSQFEAGSNARAAAEVVVELVGMAHALFEGMIAQDQRATVDAQNILKSKLASMGLADKTDLDAVASIILTMAAVLPPGSFGTPPGGNND